MRVKKLLFLLVLLTIAGRAAAQSISVGDVNFKVGETGEIKVNMEMPENTYTAFQFDVFLPTGIDFAVSKTGKRRASLSDDRIVIEDGERSHSINVGEPTTVEGGLKYTVIVYSSGNVNLQGSSGQMASLYVTADNNASGDLQASISGAKIASSGGSGGVGQGAVTMSSVNFTISVQGLPTVTVGSPSIVYGNAFNKNSITFTVTGDLADGDKPSTDGFTVKKQGSDTEISDLSKLEAGKYDLIAPTSTKYKSTNGVLEVTKAPLTITANNATMTQGDALPTFSATYSGFVFGEKETDEGVLSGTLQFDLPDGVTNTSAAGNYEITPSGVTANNYDITFAKGQLTINAAAAAVPATVTAKEGLKYSGVDQALITVEGTATNGTMQYMIGENGEYSDAIPQKKDAGTYDVYYYAKSEDGIHPSSAPTMVQVTIAKAPVTIKLKESGYTVEYGKKEPNYVLVYSGLQNGEKPKDTFTSLPTATAGTAAKNVGEYDIEISGAEASNYAITYETGKKLTITPKTVSVDWSNTPLTYNGQVQAPTAELSSGVLVGEDQCTVTVTGGQTNAGENYTATAESLSNSNYALPETKPTTTFSIAKYDITDNENVTIAAISPVVFNGSAQTPTPEVTISGVEGAVTVSYGYENNTNVGTATVTVTGTGNFTGTKSTTFNITKTPAIAATVTAKTDLVYTGQAQELVTVGEGLVGGEMQYRLGDGAYGTAVPTATNAGTYTVYYKVVADDDHEDVAEQSVEVTIAKAAASVTLANWATTLTYNGAEQGLVEADKFTVTDGCTLTFIKEDNTETTNAADIKGKDAKTYTIKYYVKGDANHSDSEQKEATRVINPLVATLTWSNTALTYNGAVQVPTAEVSNKINGDACEVTVEGGAKDYKAEGTYTATATALSNANYQLPETKTQAFTIAQYDIKENKAKLTIAAIDKVNYTGQEHKPEPTVTAEGITGDVTVTYTYADNINVGTGKVKIEGTGNFKGVLESTDFDAESKTLTFEIDKAAGTAATVTAKTGLVYTGAAQELITATGDVTEGCKMEYKVDDAADFAEALPTAITAGTHTVSWRLNGGENYGTTNPVDVTVEIAKAALTVKAEDKTKVYGEADPAFTVTYEGFLGSDTKEVFTTEPTAAVSGEHVNAGDYDITVTDGESANYTFSPVNGKLTIMKKTVGLTWSDAPLTYNNKEQGPTATATGLVGTDECTVTVEGAKKDAGSHTATATGLSNNNYQLPTEGTTQAFTIAQADFSSVVLNPASLTNVTYNGMDQKPTVAVTFGSGEDAFTLDAATEYTVSYKLGDETVTSLTDAGTYTVVIDSKEKNFNAGQKTLTLTIDKANLSAATVSVSDQEYTGSALTPVPTVTINGTVVPASDYDVAYENNTNIGTATVTVTALANSKNFTANTTATGSFSIYEPYVPPTFSTDEGEEVDAYTTSGNEVTVTQLSPAMLNGTEEIPSELNSSEGGTYKVTEIAAYAFRNMPADVVLTLPEGVKTTSPVKNVINGDGTCKELDLTQVKNFEPAKTLTIEQVTYKREMKTEAITVCMPYEVDVPEGVTAYVLKGDTEGKVTFDLLEGTKVPAYLPCMLRREVPAGARGTGLTAPEAVTIDLSARNVVINPSDGDEVMKRDDFELCGTTTGLTHKEGYDLQAFILQPDMTWKMTASAAVEDADKQYLAPFQAYLCSTRSISGSIDMQLDSTTGIDAVINDNGEMTSDNEGWYDLNGRKLAGKPTTKGIYVKNGRKVVIK